MASNDKFPVPIRYYHIHVYFKQNNAKHVKSAEALRQRIVDEFPSAKCLPLCMTPAGPHLTGMFEVQIRSPALFGVLVPWMAIHHGDHSALVHPLTDDYEGTFEDHTQHAIWIGEKMPVDADILKLTPEELQAYRAAKMKELGITK